MVDVRVGVGLTYIWIIDFTSYLKIIIWAYSHCFFIFYYFIMNNTSFFDQIIISKYNLWSLFSNNMTSWIYNASFSKDNVSFYISIGTYNTIVLLFIYNLWDLFRWRCFVIHIKLIIFYINLIYIKKIINL